MENNNQIIQDSIKDFVDFLYEEFADDSDNNRLNRFLDHFETLLEDIECEYINRRNLLNYINNCYSDIFDYVDLADGIRATEVLQKCINERVGWNDN